MDVRRDTDIETLYQSLTASNFSIPDLVNRTIYGRSPREQVEILVSFLDSSAELDERVAAFSNVIYGKLRLHDLYLHKYESLESFHEVVDYDKSIAPRIVLHNENEQRKGNLLKAVEQNWKCPIATLFPGQLPINFSQRLLRSLKALSELPDVSRSEAIALVKEQIAARIAESKEVGRPGGRLYSNIIIVRDVEETIKILLGTHQKNPPAEPEVYFNSTTVRPLSGMVGSKINAPIRTVTPVDDSEVIVTSLARNSGNLRKRTRSAASLERASGNSTPSDRSVGVKLQTFHNLNAYVC